MSLDCTDFQEQARLHIRKWLNENRTSQSELERAAGMGRGMVTKIVNGKKGVGHKSFRRLGAVVDWPADDGRRSHHAGDFERREMDKRNRRGWLKRLKAAESTSRKNLPRPRANGRDGTGVYATNYT